MNMVELLSKLVAFDAQEPHRIAMCLPTTQHSSRIPLQLKAKWNQFTSSLID
jgi:hypothetical protein